MPRMSGIEAIAEIKKSNPDARILVVTSFAEDEKVFSAIKSGALGYLLKDSSPQELLDAIREVYRGEPSLLSVGLVSRSESRRRKRRLAARPRCEAQLHADGAALPYLGSFEFAESFQIPL